MNGQADDDQELRALFARLPRSIEPERDLWAGIGARLEPTAQPTLVPRKFVAMPWALAASAASVVVGALMVIAFQRHVAPIPPPVVAADAAAEYSFVPASTDAMRKRLRAACVAQMANLPAKTTRVRRNFAASACNLSKNRRPCM